MAQKSTKSSDRLRLKDPNGQEYLATSPADWHNLVAQGYKPVGDGPDNAPQTAGSEPAKLDNKPVN